MAEAKALYNNQSNRGSAFILGNSGWQTPLGMVQQQEEVKRQEQIRGEQVKAQREKEAADQLRKLYETDFGSFWDRDHAYVNEALSGIHDKAAQYSMQGVNWSNPLTNPQEFAEIQKGIQEARRRYNISDQQYKQYQGLLDLSNKDEDGIYDKERIKAELENYAKATPEERANMVLAADKYYNIANVANGLFKGYEPQAETTYSTNGKGGVTHRTVKTYTPEQLDKMAGLLREDTKFKASVKSDFNSLDEEQKKAAGGLEGYMQARSKEVAELYQRKDVENKYGVDSSFWQQKNFDYKTNKANGKDEKYRNSVTNRFELVHSMLTNKNSAGYQPLVGGKHGNYPIMAATRKVKNGKAVLELTVGLGSTTGEFIQDENGNMTWVPSKTKETKTDVIDLDLSQQGIHWVLNGIINSKGKEKVDDEDLRSYAGNNNRWGLGNSGNKKPITAPSQSSSTTDDDEYWNSDDSSANEGDYWNE